MDTTRFSAISRVAMAAAALAAASCGSSGNNGIFTTGGGGGGSDAGTGGASGTGASSTGSGGASGGNSSGSGGASASGGATGSGGNANGGTAGSGGTASGGTTGSGGTASGGATGSGGTASGGVSGGGGTPGDAGSSPCPDVIGAYSVAKVGDGCGDLRTDVPQCILKTPTVCRAHFKSAGDSGKAALNGLVDLQTDGSFDSGAVMFGTVQRSGCIGTWDEGTSTMAVTCGGFNTSQSCTATLVRTSATCP